MGTLIGLLLSSILALLPFNISRHQTPLSNRPATASAQITTRNRPPTTPPITKKPKRLSGGRTNDANNVSNTTDKSNQGQLHDCVIGGKVLQLTYSECQHQLDLEIANDEETLKNFDPSKILAQWKQDNQNYYKSSLVPTITMPQPQVAMPTLFTLPQEPNTDSNSTADQTTKPDDCSQLAGQIDAQASSNNLIGGVVNADICQALQQAGCPTQNYCYKGPVSQAP